MKTKVESFTLAELLVVMVITAIIAGIAFTVLRLVQNQVHVIQENFRKTSELSLFEQKLWQDFNGAGIASFDDSKQILTIQSEIDTISYIFKQQYVLTKNDTISLKVKVTDAFFLGRKATGAIDAISLSATEEIPDYQIFISRQNDATLFMNQDGI